MLEALSARDLIGLAGVPVVVGLVEVMKGLWPGLSARFYPLLALVFGVGINLGLMGYSGLQPTESVAVGVVVALMASGLYSQAKAFS